MGVFEEIQEISYTPGAISAPEFDWARNIAKRLDEETVSSLNYQASSAFSLFWNIAKNQFPNEVIGDIQKFYKRTAFPGWLEPETVLW